MTRTARTLLALALLATACDPDDRTTSDGASSSSGDEPTTNVQADDANDDDGSTGQPEDSTGDAGDSSTGDEGSGSGGAGGGSCEQVGCVSGAALMVCARDPVTDEPMCVAPCQGDDVCAVGMECRYVGGVTPLCFPV